jgi:hypothetical protein
MKAKQISPNGLKSDTQYLEELHEMFPNVPYQTIKKLESRIFNETELKNKLRELNEQ